MPLGQTLIISPHTVHLPLTRRAWWPAVTRYGAVGSRSHRVRAASTWITTRQPTGLTASRTTHITDSTPAPAIIRWLNGPVLPHQAAISALTLYIHIHI